MDVMWRLRGNVQADAITNYLMNEPFPINLHNAKVQNQQFLNFSLPVHSLSIIPDFSTSLQLNPSVFPYYSQQFQLNNSILIFQLQHFMKTVENRDDQNCNFEDELDNLLSQRVGQLNLALGQVKCLAQLENCQKRREASRERKPLQQRQDSSQGKAVEKSIKMKKHEEQGKFAKQARMKRTSAPRVEVFMIETGRLFEIGSTKQGKGSILTEKKNIKVGEYSGKAVLIMPNNKKYEGEWVDGKLTGQAKITYPNGDIYLGSVYNYEQHGKGYLYFRSGEKYVGDFICGEFHGQGCFYNKQGVLIYDGEWRKGKIMYK